MRFLYTILFTAIIFLPASATIINIPDDYETIQEGIDASTDGDTVLVQPGTYRENIEFNRENIVLGSMYLFTEDSSYVLSTIIDGSSRGTVVSFLSTVTPNTVISGFTIRNGYALIGGGIRCEDASPTIRDNIITDNVAISYGGGIKCSQSNPIISNNSIIGNYAVIDAGGLDLFMSSPIISNSIISENSALWGGGIYGFGADFILSNSVVATNSARWGGGICLDDSAPEISNCTFQGNIADTLGGGLLSWANYRTPEIINCIFWNDSAAVDDEINVAGSSGVVIIYCDIEGGWEGEGNIDVDPLFRDPANGDYHLMSTACGDPYDSPCIDVGHPDIIDSLLDCSWGLGTILSDMGAYGGGDSATVGITDHQPRVPDRFALLQNYPNPFNARTVIRYSLPAESDVTIEIYDILGRRIETLVDEKTRAGYHKAVWNAIDRSSGIYFYRIQAGEHSETRKILLIR